MNPGHETTPDGTPYEYTVHQQDLDAGRAVVAKALPAFEVTTFMAFDVPGEPLLQKTTYTVSAKRLHEFLSDPRWQDTSETIVVVTPEQRIDVHVARTRSGAQHAGSSN